MKKLLKNNNPIIIGGHNFGITTCSSKPVLVVGDDNQSVLLQSQSALSNIDIEVIVDNDLVKEHEQRRKDEAAMLSIGLYTKSLLSPNKNLNNLFSVDKIKTTKNSNKQKKARAKSKRAKRARKN